MESQKAVRGERKKSKEVQPTKGVELTSECDFLDMFVGLEEPIDLRIPDTLVLNNGGKSIY